MRERERERERFEVFALRPLFLLLYRVVVHTQKKNAVKKAAQKETKKSKQYTIRIVYVFCSSLGVTMAKEKQRAKDRFLRGEEREILRDC